MVKKILKKTKDILFSDPRLLLKEDREYIKKPFYFQGDNGKAVLLLHGWSTTPYELRRLGIFLNKQGYTVHAPMLSGHGTVPSDLENVVYEDWINDAQGAYSKLNENSEKVFIGGTSMGATLAMQLAKNNPEIDGIILMATPYRLRFEKILKFFVSAISRFKKYHKKFYPPTFGRATTITRIISYQSYPFKNILELEKLVKESREDLNKIFQPCFVIQSSSDHIVTKKSLVNIYDQVSSSKKRKKYIKRAYHTFISDIKNEHIFEDILNFLEEN